MSLAQGVSDSSEERTKRNGDALVAALQSYYAAERRYPAALDELVPPYLPALPEALTTQGTGWLYMSDTQQYTLGYWYNPGKIDFFLCRYQSHEPGWTCRVELHSAAGWAPFEPVPTSATPG